MTEVESNAEGPFETSCQVSSSSDHGEQQNVPSVTTEGNENVDNEVSLSSVGGQDTAQASSPSQSQQNSSIAPTEIDLISDEKLDRSSPELWPRNLSSSASHVIAKSSKKNAGKDESGTKKLTSEIWAQGLDPDDINLLHQFGSLTSAGLIEEVKKLQNIAHQLGLEESKEVTRGKLLRVLEDCDEEEGEKENSMSPVH